MLRQSPGQQVSKSFPQPSDSALVVGHRKALPVRPQRHLQLSLGYLDPDLPFDFHHHRTSSRCLPSLAIRDFLPLQPFGLERRDGAATCAARRGLGFTAAPVCRATSFDASTTFATYKVEGAWQSYAMAPDIGVHRAMPKGLTFDQACNLLLNYETPYYVYVNRAKLQPGETVLITGASGAAGMAAVQVAKILGATVIASGRSDEKLAQ